MNRKDVSVSLADRYSQHLSQAKHASTHMALKSPHVVPCVTNLLTHTSGMPSEVCVCCKRESCKNIGTTCAKSQGNSKWNLCRAYDRWNMTFETVLGSWRIISDSSFDTKWRDRVLASTHTHTQTHTHNNNNIIIITSRTRYFKTKTQYQTQCSMWRLRWMSII
jgi:hypothetical protein